VSALKIFQWVAILGTLLTGMYSLLFPTQVEGFTGLHPVGGRGITEIRAILGAIFIGLALAAVVLDQTVTFPMLGITYLVVAAVRTAAMFVDKSFVSSNYISIAVEVVFGLLLVL